jgi:hypothetical protein
MIGTISEYIILVFHFLFILYQIYIEKKILKNSSKASEKLIKSKEFFIYTEKNEKQYSVDEIGLEEEKLISQRLQPVICEDDDDYDSDEESEPEN